MVSLTILGCIVMSAFFMATTTIFKGISALFDALLEMIDVLALLLLGGVGILAMELLVTLFGGGFWTIFWTVAAFIALCALLGAFISLIGAIFAWVFQIALYIVLYAFGALNIALEKLGEWSELGLKFFLGTINKKIALS